MKYLYASLFLLSLLYACGGKDRQTSEYNTDSDEDLYNDEVLIGKWDVKWEMTGEEVVDFPAESRKMSGKMKFMSTGEVEVITYGYKGCLFMQDTSTNVMNWKLENQVLRFMDKEDIHGIPYTIEQIDRREIKLSIMENIYLTLKKE